MAVSGESTSSTTSLARAGLQILAVLGLVVSASWIVAMIVSGNTSAGSETQKYADQAVGLGLAWGLLFFVVIGLMILGLVALTAHFYATPNRSLALTGLVAGTLSLILLEAVWAVLSLGSAVVAQMYRDGNTSVVPVLQKFEGGNLAGLLNAVFGVDVLLGLIAAIAFGAAIWRSVVFPRWSAIAFGLGFVLIAVAAPFTSMPGGIIFAVACYAMARALGARSASPAEVRPA